MTGKEIFSMKSEFYSSQIDLSGFANGVYTGLIHMDGTVIAKKIVIQQ